MFLAGIGIIFFFSTPRADRFCYNPHFYRIGIGVRYQVLERPELETVPFHRVLRLGIHGISPPFWFFLYSGVRRLYVYLLHRQMTASV
jgi:hypothetical protein